MLGGVTKDGLNKYAQSGIVLEVNTAPTLDVGMKVGSVSEQGTVEAAAIQVETRTQSKFGYKRNSFTRSET